MKQQNTNTPPQHRISCHLRTKKALETLEKFLKPHNVMVEESMERKFEHRLLNKHIWRPWTITTHAMYIRAEKFLSTWHVQIIYLWYLWMINIHIFYAKCCDKLWMNHELIAIRPKASHLRSIVHYVFFFPIHFIILDLTGVALSYFFRLVSHMHVKC